MKEGKKKREQEGMHFKVQIPGYDVVSQGPVSFQNLSTDKARNKRKLLFAQLPRQELSKRVYVNKENSIQSGI